MVSPHTVNSNLSRPVPTRITKNVRITMGPAPPVYENDWPVFGAREMWEKATSIDGYFAGWETDETADEEPSRSEVDHVKIRTTRNVGCQTGPWEPWKPELYGLTTRSGSFNTDRYD